MTEHAHSPYLEDIPLEEALARWWSVLADAGLDRPLPGESVALEDAAGRITAEPVWALISSPHYHAAAMDGYAVRAEETRGATETHPVHLDVGQQAFYVDTGDPLPPSTNAVIMVEDVQVRERTGEGERERGREGERARDQRHSPILPFSAFSAFAIRNPQSRFWPPLRPGSTSGRWARTWSPRS